MNPALIPAGLVLALVQIVAALPWLVALNWDSLRRTWQKSRHRLGNVALFGVLAFLGLGVALGLGIGVVGKREMLETWGKVYGAILQIQLVADLFVLVFAVLALSWPKGAAVTRAAFRESYRQPMFWLFVAAAGALMILSPFIPYFTFGEDYVMVKELGFDTIMLAAVAFGALAASSSISEEIEGRTAVTLMSKPISRRQFLLGKYVGILMACLVLVAGLGWFFQIVLMYKRWFEQMPAVAPEGELARWVTGLGFPEDARHFIWGTASWALQAREVTPGLVLSTSLIMVLVGLAVGLATRLPMVVNLVTCLVIYFLSNLMPVLVQTTAPRPGTTQGAGLRLLHFMAQLFETLLPGLDLFRVRPTLVDESSLPVREYLAHVGSVTAYGLMFTAIALLVGLILFEDRDLA